MADGRRFKTRLFGHNSAADCRISVKFCGEAVFHRILVMGQIPAFYGTYFFVFQVVWASASSAFRIVSDTLVNVHISTSTHMKNMCKVFKQQVQIEVVTYSSPSASISVATRNLQGGPN